MKVKKIFIEQELTSQEGYYLAEAIFSFLMNAGGHYSSLEEQLKKLCAIFELSFYNEYIKDGTKADMRDE